jgi:hypothetical protein
MTEHKDLLIAVHFNHLVTETYSVLNYPLSCYSIRNTTPIYYSCVVIYSHIKQCRELQEILKVLLGRIRIPLYANANVINEGSFSKNVREAITGGVLHR